MKLGVAATSLPTSSQMNGSQHEKNSNLVHTVFERINHNHLEITDLLKVDFLLYYISSVPELEQFTTKEKFEHDTAIEQMLQLGDGLGFDVGKESSYRRMQNRGIVEKQDCRPWNGILCF